MSKGSKCKTVLVLGGARSGKSDFALRLAEELAASPSNEKVYLATATALDKEMEERIALHQKNREGFALIEEPVDISSALASSEGSVVLLDCVTLWLMNLVEAGLTDDEVSARAKEFSAVAANSQASVIAVSNELGGGIVPENKMSRRFRDLSGRINQQLAASFSDVYLVTAGIAQKIK